MILSQGKSGKSDKVKTVKNTFVENKNFAMFWFMTWIKQVPEK